MSDRSRLGRFDLNGANRRVKRMTLNYLLGKTTQSRQALMSPLSLDPVGRDYAEDFGHPKGMLSPQQYKDMYDFRGIARRAVDVFPDESWSVYPELYEEADPDVLTPFEKKWAELLKKHHIWHYLHRVDKRSGIGQFGIIYIGLNDGKDPSLPAAGLDPRTGEPDNKAPAGQDMIFLRVFDQTLVDVEEVETNPASPRFSLPTLYSLTVAAPPGLSGTTTGDSFSAAVPLKVHWTRIQHVADNRGASEVAGDPRLQALTPRVLDIDKIAGASGEMFYRGGLPGWSIETFPELSEEAELDSDSVKEEFENWSNGMQRYMRLVGMTMKSLAPQVADPSSHLTQQLRLLCASMGIPMRIFLGSETAEGSADSDIRTWNRRLGQRQRTYIDPMIIRPFVGRLIALGVLPKPKDYFIDWNDLNAMSDLQKADVALKLSQALMQYFTSKSYKFFPVRQYLTSILGLSPGVAGMIIESAGGEAGIKAALDKMEKDENKAATAGATKPAAKTQGGGRKGKPARKSAGRPTRASRK